MRTIYTLCFIILIGGISFAAYMIAFDRFEKSASASSTARLSLYQAGLLSTLERVAHLPKVMQLHPNTREVLRQGKSVVSFNEYLKEINNEAGAAALYLLDAEANTIAASNFDSAESFVGNNYRFRTYFTDAVKNGTGRFFAVGVTTGRPGYFLSEVIRDQKKLLGVAVVKVEFTELLQYWEEASDDVFITNPDGVIVLASRPERLYKTTREVPADRLEEMKQTRKFSNYRLDPLEYVSQSKSGLLEGRITVDGIEHSVSSVATPKINWQLHFLTPLAPAHASAMAVASVAFLLCGFAGIGALYARSKVERSKLEIIAVEADRVRMANIRLEEEVTERKRTEHRLRETQAELIQSSRLAALGKMSAAIVHEVNQPVSAIRTYTSSGLLLLKNRRTKDAKEVFSQIAKMTERLGAITSDLLVFSRKPVSQPQSIDLNQLILSLLDERGIVLQEAGVSVDLDLWTKKLEVSGSEHRFAQLVGNLIQNAMQALEGKADGRISITTIADPSSAVLMVADNGPGIPEAIIDQLFDPFFTTKEVGKGAGLGLALAYAIADEANGRIRCENRVEGGALFILELPLETSRNEAFAKEPGE
jgi:two-component system C4-dicarboxylate transport sensor histidine kinase DctB